MKTLCIDFTFTDWKLQKGYSVMEDFGIAKLEEELGLHGYLHNSSSMCNRTTGLFANSTNGWKNGMNTLTTTQENIILNYLINLFFMYRTNCSISFYNQHAHVKFI